MPNPLAPSRLGWICFYVIVGCTFVNLVLRQVLPTMPQGVLTGLLWLLTDLNRLLVLAALVGLVVSAVWAVRRHAR